jgi:serine/threonine protein kinase
MFLEKRITRDVNIMDHHKLLQVDPRAEEPVIRAAHGVLRGAHEHDTFMLDRLDEALQALIGPNRPAPEDLRKGKLVGGYRIISRIAEGGFGTTYVGEHETTRCPVCIKHALHISPTDEALLLEEARICWDLRHWGIPAIRDVIRMPDDSLAIVMSFIPGHTLEQVRELPEHRDGIAPEHVAWITERMLNILKYLHFNGVVNGDVKPANTIIQPEGHTVTLVDYGLSVLRPTSSDSAKGYTPFYASPEHLLGRPLIPESDLYGLGMTMIFALGGDVEHIRVPGSTPPALCGFIKDLIRRDPLSRPNWNKVDLCQTIQDVRMTDFGRTASNMMKL